MTQRSCGVEISADVIKAEHIVLFVCGLKTLFTIDKQIMSRRTRLIFISGSRGRTRRTYDFVYAPKANISHFVFARFALSAMT